jgi:hypothetical protein
VAGGDFTVAMETVRQQEFAGPMKSALFAVQTMLDGSIAITCPEQAVISARADRSSRLFRHHSPR